MDTAAYLQELSKKLWHSYLLEPTKENFEGILGVSADTLTMIGTGKHEIYNSIAEIAKNLMENQKDAAHIKLDLIDEWYETQLIREDVALVYGGIWVREHTEKVADSLIEMDTRFSILYARDTAGCWKIEHFHHSMPYFDQGQNEYYPKALSAKVREALQLVELFKKRSETDLMTGILNHDSFQKQAEELLRAPGCCCLFVLDLDNFKQVNDNYGHSRGDALLKLLAKTLHKHFCEIAIVGRIGGDEFAICKSGAVDRPLCERKLTAVWREYSEKAALLVDGAVMGYSVGIAAKESGDMTYPTLFRRADEALYRAKHQGKGTFVWYGETE